MSTHDRSAVSDELINAFIDRQITMEERQEILTSIRNDKELAGRICELQQLKEMTQTAFDDIPPAPSSKQNCPALFPRRVIAAVLFAIGILVGLGSMQLTNSITSASAMPAAQEEITKVLVHLTSADIDAGLNTLNNLQQILDRYQQKKQKVLIEVIANGDGIKLLQNSNTRIAKRIAALSSQHDNLTFAACKNTIDQLRLTRGIRIDLIPQVKLIDSGVVKVIERQNEGWTYIRG